MRSIKYITKLFDKGNVSVCGLRGCGKDLLFGNVIHRRKLKYCSNLDYGGNYIPFDYKDFDTHNTFSNFVTGNIINYTYPHGYNTDLYLSDCGIYFPSQYQNELIKLFKSFPCYMALSRQLSRNNVHTNSQSLGRVWDKIREQSDIYIRCNKCIYIKGLNLVIQNLTIYDKYESALNSVKPCRVKMPLICSSKNRLMYRMYIDNFENNHGKIDNFTIVYFNRSKHDTYYFEKLLGGCVNEKEK